MLLKKQRAKEIHATLLHGYCDCYCFKLVVPVDNVWWIRAVSYFKQNDGTVTSTVGVSKHRNDSDDNVMSMN